MVSSFKYFIQNILKSVNIKGFKNDPNVSLEGRHLLHVCSLEGGLVSVPKQILHSYAMSVFLVLLRSISSGGMSSLETP